MDGPWTNKREKKEGSLREYFVGSSITSIVKSCLWGKMQEWSNPGAGFSGEVVACLVRVPVEIVKQWRQADAQRTAVEIVRQTLRSEGKSTSWHFDLYQLAHTVPKGPSNSRYPKPPYDSILTTFKCALQMKEFLNRICIKIGYAIIFYKFWLQIISFVKHIWRL